jgi:hypothetical protein
LSLAFTAFFVTFFTAFFAAFTGFFAATFLTAFLAVPVAALAVFVAFAFVVDTTVAYPLIEAGRASGTHRVIPPLRKAIGDARRKASCKNAVANIEKGRCVESMSDREMADLGAVAADTNRKLVLSRQAK